MSKSPTVTAALFAQHVAAQLKARREQLAWTPTDVQHHGGPTYHTVQKTERGKLAPHAVLERHCVALGLTLQDVYLSALMPHGQDDALLSREARAVAEQYDRAGASGQALVRNLLTHLDLEGRTRRRLAHVELRQAR